MNIRVKVMILMAMIVFTLLPTSPTESKAVIDITSTQQKKVLITKTIKQSQIEQEPTMTLEEKRKLRQELEDKIFNANSLLQQITENYSTENKEIESEISEILLEVEKKLSENPDMFSDIQEDYTVCENRLKEYQEMIQAIHEKSSIEISSQTDMSKPVGFTKEELQYLLQNVKNSQGDFVIEDRSFAEELAKAIAQGVEEYPVNEFCVLGIMSFETGYFTSWLAENHYNYGGLLKSDGTGFKFESVEEGVIATVKCIHSNLKGNNTIYDINKSYCSPIDGDEFGWAKNVLIILKTYTSFGIREEQ